MTSPVPAPIRVAPVAVAEAAEELGAGALIAPEYLSPGARAEWDRLMPLAARIRPLTDVDEPAFVMLCETVAHEKTLRETLRREGATVKTRSGMDRTHPALHGLSKARSTMLKLLKAFGLLTTGRSKGEEARLRATRPEDNYFRAVKERRVLEKRADLDSTDPTRFPTYRRGQYVARADAYARAVVAGKVPANRLVRAACKRHLDDLEKSKQKSHPYRFDVDAAEAPCRFAEGLPHVKGRWAKKRERYRLGNWQCFLLCVLFGWLRVGSDLRRFRETYWEISRKNGKSPLAAIIGLYCWCLDGEAGAEVYAGATTEHQAWEVFGPAQQMLKSSPELLEFVGAQPLAKKLLLEDKSKFEPVIGKPGDGASPSCAIIDEYHEHDTSDLVDTMATGMVGREQPLLLKITTAGVNLAGPCYDERVTAIKVLEGVWVNEEQFIVIYGIDEPDASGAGGDDWTAPASLRKANPNYGVSVDVEILEANQRQAVLDPTKQTRFKTKHLNVWCAAKVAWMSIPLWDACADPSLRIEELAGEDCIEVLDLASKDDLAVKLTMFRKKIGDADHFYLFPKFYLPSKALEIEGPNQVAYRRWARDGILTLSEGDEISFSQVEDDVKADIARHQLREIVFDPWRATHLAQRVADEGATTVELRQTVQNLSTPMKELHSAIRARRVHHDGNPALRWMFSNVVALTDAKDNIYPRKEKPFMKIDGVVATIMGMARLMVSDSDSGFSEWLKELSR